MGKSIELYPLSKITPLRESFYIRENVLTIAKELLGKILGKILMVYSPQQGL